LPKTVKIEDENYLSMRTNSIRKKLLKDMFYQVKEYLHQNLSYLIERLDKHLDIMAKDDKGAKK
jgi:hypothetical protein